MLAVVLTLFVHVAIGQSPAPLAITGVVRDGGGNVVPGAVVIARAAAESDLQARQTTTGPDGRFTIAPAAAGEIVLIVRASGFAEFRQTIAAGAARQSLDITLLPATFLETVTVTPARGEERLRNLPASVSVIGRDEIRQSPAAIADELLRRLPAFSLFRRTSSIAAHPTTQGVSLRGIGPSGVSRTLVLVDGVPFNDPFGGWVYWTRLPLERADRIEVVDSSSSSLYGNYAMGGVINVVTAPPAPRTFELRTQYGNLNSPRVDASASHVWGRVGVAGDVSVSSTDGYPPVVRTNPAGVAERGLVDDNVSLVTRRVNVRMDYRASERARVVFRAGYFREERDNGKHSTINGAPEANDTTWKSASAGVRLRLPDRSEIDASLAFDDGRFHSNFLAVPPATPPRSLGRMTLDQVVPTVSAGVMAQWRRAIGGRHLASAGADWRRVDGDSREDALDGVAGTQVTLKRVSGGTQRSAGIFVQDIVTISPDLTLTASARLDAWRNYDAHNLETSFPSGVPTLNHAPSLPDRSDTVVSPRIAALYRVTDRVSVWGNIGAGFRAPTLNELYRQFRVGTVTTLPNHQLGPERLVGGEIGIHVIPLPRLTWRATWFGNRISDPVSNVTIAMSGNNVTQQRQNLGRTRVTGLQTDVEYRVGAAWRITGGYLYNRARVTKNPANPALVGTFLPQVPRHRGTVQVSYTNPRYVNLALEVLAIGRQFDDDANTRTVPGYAEPGLPKYGVVSVTASRAIGRRLDVFLSVQNLFDREYFAGTLPTITGSPRLVAGGIRVRINGQ